MEFWRAGLFGTFSTFRNRVTMTVGDFLPGETANLSLTLYDKNGVQLGQPGRVSVTGRDGTATLTAVAPGATPEVAFFLVQADETNRHVWVDELAFNDPTTTAPPDFTIAVQGIQPPTFYVTQGGSTTAPLPLVRYNGSNGDITLKASGLPPGVTATFTPNPVPGLQTTSQMTLSVVNGVPTTQGTSFMVTATPAGPSVGPGPHSAQLALSIWPAISVSFGRGPFDLGACTLLTIGPIDVTRDPAVVRDALVLSVRLLNPDGTTGDLPQGIHANFTPPTSQAPGTLHTLAMSVDLGALGATGQLTFVIQASGGVWNVQSLPFIIRGGGFGITSITSSGTIPNAILNQPGSEIVIGGFGFCPGIRVEFGNDRARVDPASLTPTEIKAFVHRYATDGPITLLAPDGSRAQSSNTFIVDSVRNWDGYNFYNYVPNTTFGQLTEEYGANETEDSIPLCWPFDCDVTFPDPIVEVIFNILKAGTDAKDGGGACFGIALSAARFRSGARALADFLPPGSRKIFDLAAFPDDHGLLTDFINSQVTAQLSEQFLINWLNQHLGHSEGLTGDSLSQIRNDIHDSLARGERPMITLKYDGGGHVVTAYDVEDVSRNPIEYFIDVYDPNLPFSSDENTDTSGGTHVGKVTASRIHVAPDGTWGLLRKTAFIDGLTVIPASSIPISPTLVGSEGAQILAIFGSVGALDQAGRSPAAPPSRTTQLTDAGGRTLYAPDGTLNRNQATRLRAAPFAFFTPSHVQETELYVADSRPGPIVQSVIGTKAGADTHTIVGPGLSARIDTTAAQNVTDQIGYDQSGGVSFSSNGPAKPVAIGLSSRNGGDARGAELVTTSAVAALEQLHFTADRSAVTVRHASAAPARLRLSLAAAKGGAVIFDSGPLQVAPGVAVTFTPQNWSTLDSVVMAIQGATSERKIEIRNSYKPAHPVTISGIAVSTVNHEPNVRVAKVESSIGDVPAGAQVAITYVVRQAGSVVDTGGQTLAEADVRPGPRTDTFRVTLEDLVGSYQIDATATVLTPAGAVVARQDDTRSITIATP
jgi:hypothetical protein